MADKTKYNYKTFRPTEINLGNKVTSSLAEDRTKITYTIPSGWNYISFPYHLDSYLISNIIPPNVYPQLTQIQDAGFGDSNASLIVNGAWLGSITSIENKKGYKLYNEGPEIEFVIETPNGWGCLYGDTDLKFSTTGQAVSTVSTEITANSLDTELPSAKAVYSALSGGALTLTSSGDVGMTSVTSSANRYKIYYLYNYIFIY